MIGVSRETSWTVGRGHIDSAHHIDHCNLHLPHRVDIPAMTGGLIRIVGGTKQARLIGKVLQYLHPIPDMVAGSLEVDAVREYLARHFRRDAKTAGGVFDIGDYVIGAEFLLKGLDRMGKRLTSGPSADVGDK
jgi:hypothetical protein